MKMIDKNGNTDAASMKGILGGPILLAAAFFVFLITAQVSGLNGWTDEIALLALPAVAATGAAFGRISSEHPSVTKLDDWIAPAILIATSLGASLVAPAALCITFLLTSMGTHVLTSKGRPIEANFLVGSIIGIYFAMIYALNSEIPDGSQTDAARAYLGARFSSMASVMVMGALYASLMLSKTLDRNSRSGMLSELPFDIKNKSTHLAAGAIMASLLVPMVWLATIDDPSVYDNGAFLGPFWGLFSAAVVMIVCLFKAERWNVLASVASLNWVIYTLGRLSDVGVSGFPAALTDDGSYPMILWLLITFWSNVGIIVLASRGYLGAMAPLREPSHLRKWWQNHNYAILVGMALVVGFIVRVVWNVIPAMNASIIGEWDMSGGSDPWYMKRIIDYVAYERAHLVFDADRNYPVGGLNPRPPLFSWSLALGGIFLSWVADMSLSEAVWWSVEAQPAIWGALIVLPVAAMARRFHSPLAGIASAWLIAFMPGHITHSTFGLADHDSFAMFFLTLGFYWWVRSMMGMRQDRLFSRTSWNPLYILAGIRFMWHSQRTTMVHATLAGISFATAGLAWKGFVYAPGILFLGYSGIVFLNLFRGRDTLPITSAMLQMLAAAIIIPLPFYIWPGMNLLTNPSGMAPMIYMLGFTLGLGYVISASRDKPWLMVFTTTATLTLTVLGVLYALQALGWYAGWDILTTGGFYFSKNKVFSTIGEAQAPDRGILFASFGPIVTIAAIGYGLMLMWRGGRNEDTASFTLGTWIVVASYMSWTAGRFIFNAGPPMAVVGGIGLTAMWAYANPAEFVKHWKKTGIGSPRARFNSTFSASRSRPGVPAALMVLLIVFSQHATYGIDSGIPRGDSSAGDVDETIQGIMPDVLRYEVLGFSVLNSNQYSPDERCTSGCWYLGTFGPGFNGGGWNMAYEWLSEQDSETAFTERPAFLSWWDYGFQALSHGQHPTVADNFQSGIPISGNILLSSGQEDVLALLVMNALRMGGVTDEDNREALGHYFQDNQIRELERIHSMSVEDVEARSLALIHEDGGVQLLSGSFLSTTGLPSKSGWYVLEDGEIVGERMDDPNEAMRLFNTTRSSSSYFSPSPTHYIIGDYRYTSDLIEDYNDLSTGIHRNNAKLAVGRAFITHTLNLDQIVGLVSDLSEVEHEVQTFEGRIGETTQRSTDVRYFAIDDRLYPLGGLFYDGYNYHGGQTTGIFYAPTTLAGLDPEDYISSSYLTRRGDGPIIPRTAGEYEQEYLDDIVRQQSGAITDQSQIIALEDIDYIQQPEFFETFLSKIYVGYGTTSLGLDPGNTGQPGPTWSRSGTPDTPLRNAYALPGAMMNHFVLANYHDDGSDYLDSDDDGTPDIYNWSDPRVDPSQYYNAIGNANSNVKILKYYSGATLTGTVTLETGEPVPNAKILIERDAFSSEEGMDTDPRTYWIPIGSETANDLGQFTSTIPSGKIRVSAFYGSVDETDARAQIESGAFDMLSDITREQVDGEDRTINPITAILGGVAGTTYLGSQVLMVDGEEGHSNGEATLAVEVSVPAVTSTGQVQWAGDPSFAGDPIKNATVVLTPADPSASHPGYSISTSSGSIEGEGLYFAGEGSAVFDGIGQFDSSSPARAEGFTGTLSQTIRNNQSVSGTGTFNGNGILNGALSEGSEPTTCGDNDTMPVGSETCLTQSGDILVSGSVNATGRFVSNGQSEFIRHYDNASFTAAGRFVVQDGASGKISGNGVFQGDGVFSGQMVREGTFHLSDAIPGEYSVSVVMDTGQEVEVSEKFSILRTPTTETRLIQVDGLSVTATLLQEDGTPATGSVVLTDTDLHSQNEPGDCALKISSPCTIDISEGGTIEIRPIPARPHTISYDSDSDGFFDVVAELSPEDAESGAMSLDLIVPVTADLEISLQSETGDLVRGLDLQIQHSSNNEVFDMAYYEDSETYKAELLPGEYLLNYTLGNTQVWERIALDQDMHKTVQFRTSSQLLGTVLTSDDDTPPGPDDFVQYAEVVARWDGFEISTVADEDGNFEFTLPVGENVTVTSTVGLGNLVDGLVVFTSEENQPISLVTRKGVVYEGIVTVNRGTYLYEDSISGWERLSVIATNESSAVTWTSEVDEIGNFEIALPVGDWTVSLLDSNFDHNPITTEQGTTIEITITTVNSTLDLFAFIDTSRDGNLTNGSGIVADFRIVPLNPNGIERNLTTSTTGSANIELEPGNYVIETSILNPDETLFGTRILTGDTNLQVPYQPTSLARDIGFDPEGVVNVTILDQLLAPVPDLDVKFRNIDTDPVTVTTLRTNEDGNILALLPTGQTIIEIDGFEPGDNTVLGVRSHVEVIAGSESPEMTLELTEMATLNITILDTESSSPVAGQRLFLESQDGLGSVKMPITNETGSSSANVVPGNWSISHDEEVGGVRIVIQETHIDQVQAGQFREVTLQAQREVTLSGKVFWDFDKDGQADVAEGVSNATILVDDGQSTVEITTDESGTYSTLVRSNVTLSITVEKGGFATMEANTSIESAPVDLDVELTAGTVTARGSITYLGESVDPAWSDDIEILLVPREGFAMPSVSADKGGGQDWDGTWSVDLEPGRYVLQIRDESRNLVAFAPIFADLVDGGQADVDLVPGGWLVMNGSWIDYEGGLHSISSIDMDLDGSDILADEITLLMESGPSVEWRLAVPSNGEIRVLLPSGSVTVSGDFEVHQQDRTMAYEAGQSISIPSSTISDSFETAPIDLRFNRISNSAISASVGSSTSAIVDEAGILVAELDGMGGYDPIFVEVVIDYEGHETSDEFNIRATVPGTDSAEWAIQIDNGSGEYTDSTTLLMSIDDDQKTISVKITPPNSTVARHFPDGRAVAIQISSDNGVNEDVEVMVNVPKTTGWSLAEEPDELYGVRPGSQQNLQLTFQNDGNSDEVFAISFDDDALPEGWTRTGVQSVTVGAFESQAVSVVLSAPEAATDEPFSLTMYVIGGDQTEYQPVVLRVSAQFAVISIDRDSVSWLGGGKDPVYGSTQTVVLTVENNGLVEAGEVVVRADHKTSAQAELSGINASTVLSIPAGGQDTAFLDLNFSSLTQGDAWIVFSIESVDGKESSEDPYTKKYNLQSPSVDEAGNATQVLMVVLIVILGGLLILLTRRPGRKPNAPF